MSFSRSASSSAASLRSHCSSVPSLFVELYDRDRDLLVRLRSDYGEWLNREADAWVPWPGSEGRWK